MHRLGYLLSTLSMSRRHTRPLHSNPNPTEEIFTPSAQLESISPINRKSNKTSLVPSSTMSKSTNLDSFEPSKSKIFELIDKFRELGIQEDISLPQLVVVGDQSSGKSSLLEGLTELPFPVASTICTRFATQITYKRTFPHEPERITVSIIPDKDRDSVTRAKLLGFARELSSLERDEFSELLEDASAVMGLPKPGEPAALGARFSNDVLRIELAGPSRSHFSVVDVPGIFQSSTQYQDDRDAEIVEGLVQRYIKDSRTIILAVANSLNETANQKVFRLAKDADPDGIRTVGVLTKPDVIQKGEELRVLDVAQNNVTVLRLGWFVVRNRSTDEVNRGVSIEDRKFKENEFFGKSPWNILPKDRVGVVALEKFLRNLLDDHVRKEFPNLVRELDDKIQNAENEMKILGPRRDTADEQRKILLKLANEFQNHSTNALMGYYKHRILAQDELKIRMHVQNLNDDFAKIILNQGHEMEFDEIQKGTNVQEAIEDEDSIYHVISTQYRETRGAELPGMVNPIVVQNLFNWQSSKWERFARSHVLRVQQRVELFNDNLLRHVCRGDKELERKVKGKLMESIKISYEQAEKELESILADEREGILLTLDHHYTEELNRARKERLEESMKRTSKIVLGSAQKTVSPADGSGGQGQQQQDITTLLNDLTLKFQNRKAEEDDNSDATDSTKESLANENSILSLITSLSHTLLSPTLSLHAHQSITDIHDILKSYYGVAKKRFIDNVASQVIERHYLGRNGPILVFGPEWVGGLNEEELGRIAGEEETVSRRRELLSEKLQKWKGARGLLGGF